jgi:hypothetical protein
MLFLLVYRLFLSTKKAESLIAFPVGGGYIGTMQRAGIVLLGLLLLWALLACSTTSGTLLDEAAQRDAKDSTVKRYTSDDAGHDPDPYPFEPGEEETGLEIRSYPRGANVYLDNRYMGITPLLLDDVEPGRHKLTLKLEGYYSESEWIDYSGDYDSYYFELEEISGFLKVEAFPPEAEIKFDSLWLPAGRLHELPIGSYNLRIRAFGYEEASHPVKIYMREVTEVPVTLEEADFDLSDLQANRTTFNPRNAGLLGTARIRFRVTTYGIGQASITDPQGRVVLRRNLGRFTTWEQGLDWNGRGPSGAPLADGGYTVRIETVAEQDGRSVTAELDLRIDSTIVLRYRSLWSGSAGLLYTPSTEVLPGGSAQFSSLFLAHSSSDSGGTNVRVPIGLGLRFGIGEQHRFELDTSLGGMIGYHEDSFFLPWFVSAAFKASLLTPSGFLSLGSAAQAKLTYQNVYTDTLANFSGLSLGLPTSVHMGSVALLFSPEIIVSPWSVSYDSSTTPAAAIHGWVYGRFGLLLDLTPVSLGASFSLRTLPFDEGFGLDLPFQAALEAHWLIPKTQLFLSLSLAGEFDPPSSYYLLGGAGLGLLN